MATPVTNDQRQVSQLLVELAQGQAPTAFAELPDDIGSSNFLPAIKGQVGTRFGTRGRVIDRAVTFYDLYQVGLLGVIDSSGNLVTGSLPTGPAGGVVGAGGTGSTDSSPPPAPTGFTAQGAFRTNILEWDDYDHVKIAYTEIWANGVDDLGTAVLIGQTEGSAANDEVNDVGIAKYYWIRFVNAKSPYLVGPYNATAGTLSETGYIGGVDLSPLIVTADKIAAGVYAGINMCPNPGAEDGTVCWSVVETSGSVAGDTFVTTTSDKVSGTYSFLSMKAAAGHSIAYGVQAIPVIPGETYGFTVSVRADANTANGLYLRINETTATPTPGVPITSATRTSFTDLLADGALNIAWTTYTYPYTVPPNVYWVSPALHHWGTGASTQMFWDDVSFGRQITASFIAAGSIAVGSAAIANGAIRNALIENLAVDTAKLANASVTNAKIDNLAVTGAKIDNATITAANIALATITGALIVNATITGALIALATITDANIASLNADKIVAGSIRGINVNASSHTTVGTYATTATAAAAGTVNVKDTTDFPAAGTAQFVDTLNDRDTFTYTGKTANTLTGCVGVLAHNANCTVVPAGMKAIVIDAGTNEMRFYGDRGDGTYEELASIGINSSGTDNCVGIFGSKNAIGAGASPIGVLGRSDTGAGVLGDAHHGVGVIGSSDLGLGGEFSGATGGIHATGGTGGAAAWFEAGSTVHGHIWMSPVAGRPSARFAGEVAMILTTGGGVDARVATPRLFYCDGVDWRRVADDTVYAG